MIPLRVSFNALSSIFKAKFLIIFNGTDVGLSAADHRFVCPQLSFSSIKDFSQNPWPPYFFKTALFSSYALFKGFLLELPVNHNA